MTVRVVHNSDFRNSLMSLAGLLAVAMPLVFGLLQAMQTLAQSQNQNTAAAPPVYEVASIKPNKSRGDRQGILFPPTGFKATNVPLHMLVRVAYGVEDNQISDEPKQTAWVVWSHLRDSGSYSSQLRPGETAASCSAQRG